MPRKISTARRGARGGRTLRIVAILLFFSLQISVFVLHLQEPVYWKETANMALDFPFQSTKLPDVVDLPSKKKPFVFFHNRKCGGSTLRLSIFNAALSHNLTNEELWIPCRGGVRCTEFENIPYVSRRAIYASHINYEDLVRVRRRMNAKRERKNQANVGSSILSRGKNATYYHLNDDHHNFDCLTNIRDTVSRVLSCYNFRFLQKGQTMKSWNMPQPDELTDSDWSVLLTQAYDKHSSGCNNEMARIFGSFNDETIINTLTSASPYFESELRRAQDRMSHCIIVHLDRCEESNVVLRYYAPWLGNDLDLCNERKNSGLVQRNHTVLQNGSIEAILAANEFDEAMFQFGKKLFEEQLQNARTQLQMR